MSTTVSRKWICSTVLIVVGFLGVGGMSSSAGAFEVYVEEIGATVQTSELTIGDILQLWDGSDDETRDALDFALLEGEYLHPRLRLDSATVDVAWEIFDWHSRSPMTAYSEVRRVIEKAALGESDKDIKELKLHWWEQIRALGPVFALKFKAAETAHFARLFEYYGAERGDNVRISLGFALRHLSDRFSATASMPVDPNSWEEFGALCRAVSAAFGKANAGYLQQGPAEDTQKTAEPSELEQSKETHEAARPDVDADGFKRPAPRMKRLREEEVELTDGDSD